MTQKEYLSTLSSKDWYSRVSWLFHEFGMQYTNSPLAIIDFLDQEYKKVEPVPGLHVCPMCWYPTALSRKDICSKCKTEFIWDGKEQKNEY